MFEAQVSAELMRLILGVANKLLVHDPPRYKTVFRGSLVQSTYAEDA